MNFPSDYRGQLAGQKWKEDSSYQFSAFGDFTFLTISNLNYEVIYLILNIFFKKQQCLCMVHNIHKMLPLAGIDNL